ncbi:MAG: amidohydrolase [Candidatus Omnitrophica bacterium]|nr:amidohydrolase [Candidatus Omnitrophota bacterium]
MSILIKNILLDNQQRDIFIQGNKIEKIGEHLNMQADEEIDGNGKTVLPGLLNMHTHSAMTLFRGYADDMPLQKWLEQKIWPLEAKLTAEDVYWGMKLACLEMIKTGTTTFADNYWFVPAGAKAVEEMGLRAVLAPPFFDLFDARKRKEAIKQTEEVFQESKNFNPRISFGLGPHSIYTVSEQGLRWLSEFAKQHNLFIQIHLSETKKEVEDCHERYNKRPAEFLDSIDFLDKNVLAAHSIWLNKNEMDILTKKRVSVAYNPCSNMKLSSGIFNYSEAKKAGLNITLGTDGCASNNNLDMFEEMKIAALLQKLDNPENLPADECLQLATQNGAKFLDLENGIEEGKLADLILIDRQKSFFTPGHNFISDIVYSAQGDCVSDVICDGKVLMRNRKVEGEEEILRKAQEVVANLLKR